MLAEVQTMNNKRGKCKYTEQIQIIAKQSKYNKVFEIHDANTKRSRALMTMYRSGLLAVTSPRCAICGTSPESGELMNLDQSSPIYFCKIYLFYLSSFILLTTWFPDTWELAKSVQKSTPGLGEQELPTAWWIVCELPELVLPILPVVTNLPNSLIGKSFLFPTKNVPSSQPRKVLPLPYTRRNSWPCYSPAIATTIAIITIIYLSVL